MLETEWPIGPNMLKFTPPDIVLVDSHGPVLVDEVKESMRIVEEEIYPQAGDVYFLMRFNEAEIGLSTDVRKYLATIKPRFKGMVIIGGSTLMRVALSIASRAVKLLAGVHYEMRMAKTLEEALAIIREFRAKEAARATPR
jgi:hypothetical protein